MPVTGSCGLRCRWLCCAEQPVPPANFGRRQRQVPPLVYFGPPHWAMSGMMWRANRVMDFFTLSMGIPGVWK